MDLHYILFNTIVYGSIATTLAAFFAFGKFLNLGIWGFLVLGGYGIHAFINHGFSWEVILALSVFLIVYFFVNWLLLHYFPHPKQRDHVGIVLTLGVSIVLENMIGYVFGPSSVSLSLISLPSWSLFLILLGLLGGFWYIFSKTMLGIILKGMFEHSNVIRWLGVPTMKILQWLFGFFLLLLLANSFLILNETNLRASDGLFYLIKGIGIMILVGVAKKEYMYLGALLYVFIEYLLFIQFWFPISYKETLIIAVIVLVLLAKPEWLFSLAKRRV